MRKQSTMSVSTRAFTKPGEMASGHVATFKRVGITGRDGARLAAEFCFSSNTSPSGMVVFVHGFGGNRDEGGLFRSLAQQAAEKGFHSVLYNWRGVSESEGDFGSTTISDHVTDFERVVEWSRTRFMNKRCFVSAVGFSLGAAVVGLALRRGIALDAVAYLSPAARPRLSMWPRYDNDQIRQGIATRGFVEKPGSTSILLGRPILDSLRDTDLGPNAFDIKVPLFVCHGTADDRIDCSFTRELVGGRNSVPEFCYMELAGASHSFRPAERYWERLSSELTTWLSVTRNFG